MGRAIGIILLVFAATAIPQCLVKAWQGIAEKKTATGYYSRGNVRVAAQTELVSGQEAVSAGWMNLGASVVIVAIVGGYWYLLRRFEE